MTLVALEARSEGARHELDPFLGVELLIEGCDLGREQAVHDVLLWEYQSHLHAILDQPSRRLQPNVAASNHCSLRRVKPAFRRMF